MPRLTRPGRSYRKLRHIQELYLHCKPPRHLQGSLSPGVQETMCNAGGDSLTEQLAIQGPAAFTALVQSALKPYSQSVAGWSPSMQKPTVGTRQVAGPLVSPARGSFRETSLAIPSFICSACSAMCLCQKANSADVYHFKWQDSSDNVRFTCADMYRYPKRSIDLFISDDAVMSEVLLAKDRCE